MGTGNVNFARILFPQCTGKCACEKFALVFQIIIIQSQREVGVTLYLLTTCRNQL